MMDFTNYNNRNVSDDYMYVEVEETPVTWQEKSKRVLKRTLSGELL